MGQFHSNESPGSEQDHRVRGGQCRTRSRRMMQAAGPDGRGTYHDDFRLSITKALGDQLAAALEKLGRAPLDEQHLKALDERPGVYQLYINEKFVYVGK